MSESFGEAMQRLQTQAGHAEEQLQEISQGILNLANDTPKHDGRLNEEGTHNVYPNNFGGVVIHANDAITWMSAKEALSLLAWLKQEESELQRLAKEQQS